MLPWASLACIQYSGYRLGRQGFREERQIDRTAPQRAVQPNETRRISNRQRSMIPGATVPIFLEKEGLRSVDAGLTYSETGEILKELAKYADALMNPQTATAVLNALDAELRVQPDSPVPCLLLGDPRGRRAG